MSVPYVLQATADAFRDDQDFREVTTGSRLEITVQPVANVIAAIVTDIIVFISPPLYQNPYQSSLLSGRLTARPQVLTTPVR